MKKQIVFGKKYLEPNMVSHLTYDFGGLWSLTLPTDIYSRTYAHASSLPSLHGYKVLGDPANEDDSQLVLDESQRMEDSQDMEVLSDMDPDGVMCSPEFARTWNVKRAPCRPLAPVGPLADVVPDDDMKTQNEESESEKESDSEGQGHGSGEGGTLDGSMELPPQEAAHREKAFRLLQLAVSW